MLSWSHCHFYEGVFPVYCPSKRSLPPLLFYWFSPKMFWDAYADITWFIYSGDLPWDLRGLLISSLHGVKKHIKRFHDKWHLAHKISWQLLMKLHDILQYLNTNEYSIKYLFPMVITNRGCNTFEFQRNSVQMPLYGIIWTAKFNFYIIPK